MDADARGERDGDAGREEVMCLHAKDPRRCQATPAAGREARDSLSASEGSSPPIPWPGLPLPHPAPPPGHPITQAWLPSAPCPVLSGPRAMAGPPCPFSILRATSWIRHLLSPDVSTAAQQVRLPGLPPPQPPPLSPTPGLSASSHIPPPSRQHILWALPSHGRRAQVRRPPLPLSPSPSPLTRPCSGLSAS